MNNDNRPNYSFIIETVTEGGETLMFWRIDQQVSDPTRLVNLDRAHNQVNRHLHQLNKRLGLGYAIYASGPRSVIDGMINRHGIEVS